MYSMYGGGEMGTAGFLSNSSQWPIGVWGGGVMTGGGGTDRGDRERGNKGI